MVASANILLPAAVLVAWTMAMNVWMFVDRRAVFGRMGVMLDKAEPGARSGDIPFPRGADWPAHNYVHLMEQPTVFYAAVFILAMSGTTGFDVVVAWLYVAIRVVHSLWQAIVNTIPVRAMLFVASSAAMIVLAIRALLAVI